MKRFLVACLSLSLFLTGCGESKPKPLPAGGKITIKGGGKVIPAGAFVVFHPTDPKLSKEIGTKPFATVEKDGTYDLTCYAEKDGAPAGDYGVTIEWRAKSGTNILGEGSGGLAIPDYFGGKYGDPNKPILKAKVDAGASNRFDFELVVDSE
jgi:hypothetical protein